MSSDPPPYPQDQPQPSSVPPPSGAQQPYGQPPPSATPPPYGGQQPPQTNALAIVSLICSIAGLLVGISAPIGAILGHVALKQIRERGEQGEGLAKAGIIIGWVLTGLALLCCGIAGVGFLSTL